MDPDGSNVAALATLPVNHYYGYAMSPADGKVAFGYSPTGTGTPQFSIFVNTSVNLTGATTAAAGPYTFVGSIVFTPDGSKIIFVASVGSSASGLYVTNADGTGSPVRLDAADDASLSPSGNVITYTKAIGGDGEICRIKVDGTGFVQITNNNSEDMLPSWTKEGDRIYFTSNRSGAFNIYSMDPGGSNVVRVTNDSDGDYGSSPNTGNTSVAFTKLAFDSQKNGVYTVAP
ncbi:MAG TPA: hypothetical protein VG820_03250, partial [Fimbriimonadaceae bacterium]|nr:hypothetical protein [Fimbriimonadaceae bacterium]